MKILRWFLGMILVCATIGTLFITSLEVAMYSDYGWYQKEYEKYEVLAPLNMEMKDVMYVTEEMMLYLRGRRANLVVDTLVNGQEREFFNDREKAHMEDVQGLFLGGLFLRRIFVLGMILSILGLKMAKIKWKTFLPNAFLVGIGVMIGVIGLFCGICMKDFERYFVVFHELFFDNDLWLLDPRTDLLIRMLPEGFFYDMVVRMGVTFIVGILGITVGCIVMKIRNKNKNNL